MRIQAIGAELAIERFDKGVVGRFAKPGESSVTPRRQSFAPGDLYASLTMIVHSRLGSPLTDPTSEPSERRGFSSQRVPSRNPRRLACRLTATNASPTSARIPATANGGSCALDLASERGSEIRLAPTRRRVQVTEREFATWAAARCPGPISQACQARPKPSG